MGKSIVDIVIELLQSAQIRVQRAYPGDRMPAIESLVAAVQLKQLDQENSLATVEISVMVPGIMGAGECEDKAVWICRLVKSIGGRCLQEKAEYLPGADLFCVGISAEFSGQETINGWVDPPSQPTFAVKLGDTPLNYAVSFTSHRSVDETAETIADAAWYFQIEELFPLDAKEETAPGEPFTITVSRTGRTETYSGCVLNTHKRVLDPDGQRQIREGEATSMTVS